MSVKGSALDLHAPVTLGSPPGFEHHEPSDRPTAIRIRVFDYSPDRVEEKMIEDLEQFLGEPQPDWVCVRWIDVEELHPYLVDAFRRKFGFHALAAEDVLHVPQRPRVEAYDDHLFITTRMPSHDQSGNLQAEQVSMFLFEHVLLTFQQWEGDVFDPIRHRLAQQTSRLRTCDAGFLAYSLLDAIVDYCFPLMERYSERLEALEDETLLAEGPAVLRRIQHAKRDVAFLRRVMWPTRELVDELLQQEDRLAPEPTYLRDVLIHVMQLLDVLEAHRESAAELMNLYVSVVSNRMNEAMKMLTAIATIFIPITFLAGVYGMNFRHFPELDWPFAYPAFWGVCVITTFALLWYFRRKRWW